MGLFSNLFGNGGKEIDDALGKMKNLAEDIANSDGQTQQSRPASANPDPSSRPIINAVEEEGPSGDSWGPKMPAEENQYNSGISYQDYFSNIITGAFASYQISKEIPAGRKALVFTFSQAGSKKLVVEIISDRTSPYKIRKDCRAQGIPYLRFYYDHKGWWNTKSYVIRRISGALGI